MNENKYLYDLNVDVRNSIIIDIHEIDGVKIETIDDYLLYFPVQRKLIHKHAKLLVANQTKAHLQYLDFIYRRKLDNIFETEDEIAQQVAKRYIRDVRSWKVSQAYLHAVFFDRKYLNLAIQREQAFNVSVQIERTAAKHWSSMYTGLTTIPVRSKLNNYYRKRQQILSKFYDFLFDGIDIPDNITVIKQYDMIEIFLTDQTILQICCAQEIFTHMTFFVDGKRITDKMRHDILMMRYGRKEPWLHDLVCKMLDNAKEINNMFTSVQKLHKEHSNECDAYLRVIECMLRDLQNDNQFGYLDSRYVKFVSFDHDTLSVYKTYFANRKLKFHKTIYQLNDEGNIDEDRTKTLTARYNILEIEKLAEHLLCSGYINAYHSDDEIDLSPYVDLLTGRTNAYYLNTFKSSIATMKAMCDTYFDEATEKIVQFHEQKNYDTVESCKARTEQFEYAYFTDFTRDRRIRFSYFEDRFRTNKPDLYEGNREANTLFQKASAQQYLKEIYANVLGKNK